MDILIKLWESSGLAHIVDNWQNCVMILVSFVLFYLAIKKKFEPLLLVCMAFGMLLSNLPGAELYHPELFIAPAGSTETLEVNLQQVFSEGGLLDFLYLGVKYNIYPCLIFLGIGAMTDFGPLLSRPSSMLMGLAAQIGIFCALGLALLMGFSPKEAASIGIIGGADGPTAIFFTSRIEPNLLGAIAIAAYSYMALIPLIQPPIMKLLTTKKEREIEMVQAKPVSKRTKIIFPIVVTAFVVLFLPDVAPLLGMLMLGNLLKECGVTERLSDTAQNALMNIVTILLGLSVGATAVGYNEITGTGFLSVKTALIVVLGFIAFCFSTAGGLLLGKLLCWITHGKINPLIGSAGVSAVPMAARVSHNEGQKANKKNYLLMHAMGPNVAGVIGSALAAGILLAIFSA